MSQTDNETIEALFNELREAGLDANTEFCALLLKHFGEVRMLREVYKEAMDRAIHWYQQYESVKEELEEANRKLADG